MLHRIPLLFAGMSDHLHAAGLLEPLGSGEPTTKKNMQGRLRCRMCQDPVPQRQGARTEEDVQGLVLES